MASDPKFTSLNVRPEFRRKVNLRAAALDKRAYQVVEDDAAAALEHEALVQTLQKRFPKIYKKLINVGAVARSSNGHAASGGART